MLKKTILPSTLVLLIFVGVAFASTVVDSYNTNNYDEGLTMAMGGQLCQSFTNSSEIALETASFYIKNTAGATGTLTSNLYSHSGVYGVSSVGGTLLSTSGVIASESLGVDYQEIPFAFSSYMLSASTEYDICVKYEFVSGSPTALQIQRDGSSPTHGGNYNNYGSSWTYNVSKDLIFYAYGADDIAIYPISITTSNTDDLLSTSQFIFNAFWPVFMIIIAIPLGFYVGKKLMSLFPRK